MSKIKMPDSMKGKVSILITKKQLAETALNNFLQGCIEGLQLKGDWNFDLGTLTFTKVNKKLPDGKEDK